MPENTILYSIILAAGKGTRFKSNLPKVLHKIGGRTLLEQAVRSAIPNTKKEIIVVSGFGFDKVEEELNKIRAKLNLDNDLKISITLQDKQLGTGHASLCGTNFIKDTSGSVLIMPGDCPLISPSLISDFLNSKTKSEFSILSVNLESPFGFGRIVRREDGFVTKIIEEKDCTSDERNIQEINTGIILSNLEVLKEYLPKLTTNNAQSEYYLTDIPELLIKDNKLVSAYVTKDQLSVRGVNSRLELALLESDWRLQHLKKLAESGVTIQSLENTFIDLDSKIEPDVFIGSGTRIYGSTEIKSGTVIEGDSLIKDSIVGENNIIKIGSYVDSSVLEDNISIGPFCHIRPKSYLMKNVKIGNFVETKAANLHQGVKANHFSYLGDIDIGENTNIGAGTIVCNYDGKNKFKSKLSSNVFIGSNSTLVSPIEVGEGAYVAAGSVITKDVPSSSLAFGRSRQVNKENWVNKENQVSTKK